MSPDAQKKELTEAIDVIRRYANGRIGDGVEFDLFSPEDECFYKLTWSAYESYADLMGQTGQGGHFQE